MSIIQNAQSKLEDIVLCNEIIYAWRQHKGLWWSTHYDDHVVDHRGLTFKVKMLKWRGIPRGNTPCTLSK